MYFRSKWNCFALTLAFIDCWIAMFVDAAIVARHTLYAEASDGFVGRVSQVAGGAVAERFVIGSFAYCVPSALGDVAGVCALSFEAG